MTAFVKTNFSNDSGYVTYEGKFVGRFKYHQKGASTSFITFLIKNFTQEEYFKALENSPPLTVATEKGYILPHIRKWLKEAGLPVTREGYKTLVAQQLARRDA